MSGGGTGGGAGGSGGGKALARTALHDVHVAAGARMVDFAGYSMPVQYSGIIEEHHAVRTAAGLFDLGHMGRLAIEGEDRVLFLDRVVTNQVRGLEPGMAKYALVLNDAGGVRDDVIYYIFPSDIFLVVNASNREKIVAWLRSHVRPAERVRIADRTLDLAMVAVQGPKAAELAKRLTDAPIEQLKNYRACRGRFAGADATIARTGYTGEDGFEVYFPAGEAARVWNDILRAGADLGVKPCGLGARNTLRLEAAMPLYGHELDEETNPFEAGLDFAVRMDKGEFVGRAALAAMLASGGPARKLRGYAVKGGKVPRDGYPIHDAGTDELCGRVTSGTPSPTRGETICLALVRADRARDDARLEADVRGTRVPLAPVPLPFYKRAKK